MFILTDKKLLNKNIYFLGISIQNNFKIKKNLYQNLITKIENVI